MKNGEGVATRMLLLMMIVHYSRLLIYMYVNKFSWIDYPKCLGRQVTR